MVHTVAFLVKAQALLQESDAEGINEAVLNRLVSQRVAQGPSPLPAGMKPADYAFQARLDIIAEALQSRHTHVPESVTTAQGASYYTSHRSQFATPAVR